MKFRRRKTELIIHNQDTNMTTKEFENYIKKLHASLDDEGSFSINEILRKLA